jgi:hypothetical protein
MERDQTTPPSGNGSRTDEFRDVRAQAGETAEAVADTARNAAEQQKQAGAEQLGGMAHAIHGAAREIEGQMPEAARFVHDAAAKLEGAADALRERSVDDLVEGFGRFARTQPLAFFGGAVLAGFAVSRFLKSSGQTTRAHQLRRHQA